MMSNDTTQVVIETDHSVPNIDQGAVGGILRVDAGKREKETSEKKHD